MHRFIRSFCEHFEIGNCCVELFVGKKRLLLNLSTSTFEVMSSLFVAANHKRIGRIRTQNPKSKIFSSCRCSIGGTSKDIDAMKKLPHHPFFHNLSTAQVKTKTSNNNHVCCTTHERRNDDLWRIGSMSLLLRCLPH
jgi:hypothetical protein